jgi:hypothetical protein
VSAAGGGSSEQKAGAAVENVAQNDHSFYCGVILSEAKDLILQAPGERKASP